jgi:hypothetical protein
MMWLRDLLDPPDRARENVRKLLARQYEQPAEDLMSPAAVAMATAIVTVYAAFTVVFGGGPTTYFHGGWSPAERVIPETWVVPLYWAGWGAVGLGLLGAALAWRGRLALAAAVLPLAVVGIIASAIAAIERQPPLAMFLPVWFPAVLGYLACSVYAICVALKRRAARGRDHGPGH